MLCGGKRHYTWDGKSRQRGLAVEPMAREPRLTRVTVQQAQGLSKSIEHGDRGGVVIGTALVIPIVGDQGQV